MRDDLLKWLGKRPFQPFRVHLSDGKTTYEIYHPDLVMVSRAAMILGVPATGERPFSRAVEDYELVSLIHVQRVVPLEASAPSTQNGPPA